MMVNLLLFFIIGLLNIKGSLEYFGKTHGGHCHFTKESISGLSEIKPKSNMYPLPTHKVFLKVAF